MKVMVILGHRLQDDGKMDAILKSRLDKAIAEYNENYDPEEDKIIVSGGIANKKAGIPEGKVMYEYLVAQGIPAENIIKEISSKTTKQNAKFSKAIIYDLGVNSITICTSRYHFDRKILNPVKLFAKQLGKGVEIKKLIAENID